jgi:fatty-acyl-CoA synthase
MKAIKLRLSFFLLKIKKKKIAHFKIPKYIEFMDHFPMTITGKIQKNKLREQITKKLKL